MYEQKFGFRMRPFSATPDARAFVGNENTQKVLSELTTVLRSGGIAVVSAPAGLGKTMLGKKLASELRSDMRVARFASANFTNRVGLLQTILFEIRGDYLESDEQKLRLNLLRALSDDGDTIEPLALIFDEAHLLTEELLEEIRTLTNLGEEEQIVRVALIGQPELEERLLEPSMTALNQRVRAQLYLDSLTRAESVEFITAQVAQQGAEVADVFAPDALRMITIAADGSPRCLNQLCDQSLVECVRNDEVVVDVTCVRTALDELKKLPLQWNDPGEFVVDSAGADQSEAVVLSCDEIEATEPDDVDVVDEDLTDNASEAADPKGLSDPAQQSDSDSSQNALTISDEPITAFFETGGVSEEEVETHRQLPKSYVVPSEVKIPNGGGAGFDDQTVIVDEESATAIFEIGAPAHTDGVPVEESAETDSADSAADGDLIPLSLVTDESDDSCVLEGSSADDEGLYGTQDSSPGESGEIPIACEFEEVVFDRYTWIEAGVDVNVIDATAETAPNEPVDLEEVEDDVVFPPLASAGLSSEEVLTLDFSAAAAAEATDDQVSEATSALAGVRAAERAASDFIADFEGDSAAPPTESDAAEAANILRIVNDALPEDPSVMSDDDPFVPLYTANAPSHAGIVPADSVVAEVAREFAAPHSSDGGEVERPSSDECLNETLEIGRASDSALSDCAWPAQPAGETADADGKASPGHRAYATLFTKLRRLRAVDTVTAARTDG